MFVGAAVSEIRKSNQNKEEEEENFENGYFQFSTFPGNIIDPFFHQLPFDFIYTLNLLDV